MINTKDTNKLPQKALQPSGISLVEILVSIVLFSLAVIGLYLAMGGMFDAIQTGMRRDIEAAYANMLISEVNPTDNLVETGYDVTTKTVYNLPDGDTVYYTRIVDSCPVAATCAADTDSDVKNVNVYFYRASTSTSPYRKYRREVAPLFFGFNLGEDTTYYKDNTGNVWSPITDDGTHQFSTTEGSRRSGWETVTPTEWSTGSAISNVPTFDRNDDGDTVDAGEQDEAHFQTGHTGASLTYTFLATVDQTYTVILGAAEADGGVAATERAMTVTINGTEVGTMDTVAEAGGTLTALTKTFAAIGVDNGSGVGVLTVALTAAGGATENPRLSFIGIARN
ncbi:MAG: malectin [Vampirovibrio sp.]|nr:malectin [Vampirovibrio sp.]